MTREPENRSSRLTHCRQEDDQLIVRVLAGDLNAFDGLMERYRDRIVSLAYHLLRNDAEAEDLAQEAFVKAFRNLNRFRQESGFYTWLYRITVNLAYTQVKKNRRRRQLRGLAEQDLVRNLHARPTAPDEAVAQAQLKEKVLDALDLLDPRLQQVLVLREIEGWDVEAVAKILGLPKGTVKSRLFRAHEDLRRALTRRSGTEEKESGHALP